MTAGGGAMARASLVSELFAVAPRVLGGVVLRGRFGPGRDRVCAWLGQLGIAPVARLPLHVTQDRLLGGLSLSATLREGRPVMERGLLASAHGGVVVAASAERLDPAVTAQLCAALDRGELTIERDGITAVTACKVGVFALDEGVDDERAPAALCDRLAFEVDVDALDAELSEPARKAVAPDAHRVARGVILLERVSIDDAALAALCQAATALGVASPRAVVLAAHAARAHCALSGRTSVEEEDVVAGAALVLSHRATRAPASGEEASEPAPAPEHLAADPAATDDDATSEPEGESRSATGLDEVVIDAAKSGIPAGLLERLAVGRAPRGAFRGGRSGSRHASFAGGRPAGIRRGTPQPGERLNVVETLRAAAPWQRLREATSESASRRVHVRKDDFRVTRFQQRSETCVVFSVDASGSAALQRLAEAKGAVEQVLHDCYARRDHVALVAFRGTTAELVLAPTRSLTRVRRGLANLAGGGTTPLAAGIDSALAVAIDARRKGRTPVIVLMTDGRANVGRESAPATADATTAAHAVREAGIPVLFLDTSPRPRPQARELAAEMSAVYLPLPYLDAPAIASEVRSLAGRRG